MLAFGLCFSLRLIDLIHSAISYFFSKFWCLTICNINVFLFFIMFAVIFPPMIVSLAWDTKMHIKYLHHQSKGSFWKALKFIFGFFIRVMCDTDIHDTWKMSYFHIVFDFKKNILWNGTEHSHRKCAKG